VGYLQFRVIRSGRERTHMSKWEKAIGAITLFVEDLDRSTAFYQDVFELPMLHKDDDAATFRFGRTYVFLSKSSAAHKMIAPATVGSPDAGPRFVFAIIVDDVDAVSAELDRKGVPRINGPADRPWGMRTLNFSDPDGYIWEIAQEVPEEAG
jgi:catechol 2,3-dioxygenase-like lactoylglutathione lyase family enzyme